MRHSYMYLHTVLLRALKASTTRLLVLRASAGHREARGGAVAGSRFAVSTTLTVTLAMVTAGVPKQAPVRACGCVCVCVESARR